MRPTASLAIGTPAFTRMATAAAVAAGVTALALKLTAADGETRAWVLAVFMPLAVAAFLSHRADPRAGYRIVLSPLGLALATYVLYYAVAALDLIASGPHPMFSELVLGMEIAAVALLPMLAAYGVLAASEARRGACLRGPTLESGPPEPVVLVLLAALFLIGTAGHLLMFRAFGGLLSSPLRRGHSFGPEVINLGLYHALSLHLGICFVLSSVWLRRSRPAALLCAGSITALLAYAALSGGRSPFVGIALMLLLVYVARRTGRPLRASRAWVALAGIIVLFYGSTLWRLGFHEERDIQTYSMHEQTFPYLSESTETFSRVLWGVPRRLDYQRGATYVTALYSTIPAALWPDKTRHVVAADVIVADYLYGMHGNSKRPPTLLGELHLNFGPVGVFVGAALFGVLLYVVQRTFRRVPEDPIALVWSCLAGPELCFMVRGPFAMHAVPLGIVTVSCLILGTALSRSARRLPAPAVARPSHSRA